jgi:hypothetical protein
MPVEQSGMSSNMAVKLCTKFVQQSKERPCSTRTAKTLTLPIVPMLPVKVWAMNVKMEESKTVQCMLVEKASSSQAE